MLGRKEREVIGRADAICWSLAELSVGVGVGAADIV